MTRLGKEGQFRCGLWVLSVVGLVGWLVLVRPGWVCFDTICQSESGRVRLGWLVGWLAGWLVGWLHEGRMSLAAHVHVEG